MAEEAKVSIFLKKCEFEIGAHIVYDSGGSKFFHWLAENIGDENVLNNDELRDYCEMEQTASTCEQKDILYGENLKKSLEELNRKFPNLTNYADDDVKKYQTELKDVSQLEEIYEMVLNDSKILWNETKKKNVQLSKKLDYAQEYTEKLNTECLQYLKEMQEIHNDIEKARQEIASICSCVQLSPCYMHQYPLEEFFSKCRDFNNYCDLYLRKNFEVIDSNMTDVECDDKYTEELEKIKQIINNSSFKLIHSEMKLSSLKSVVKELDNYNRISYGYQDMKHELEQTTQENKELCLQLNTLKDILKKLVHKLNQQKVNRLIHDANAYKIQRAEQRLKDIQQIDNTSHKYMLLCELLWFSVNFDMDMLNAYKNVLRDDTAEGRSHMNCLKRIEKLNALSLEDSVTNYTTEFNNEVAKRLTYSNFIQITLKDYDDLLSYIPIQLDTISNKTGYSNLNQYIQFLHENSNIIIKLLDDGPLVKPQIINSDLINITYNCQIEKSKISKKLSELKSVFNQNFKVNWLNNKIWKYSNLLWIWFLTEPKKVTEAIDEVKSIESTTRKAVSGILCKRM